jgi:nitrate/TMAO reductase-like tetraheme cytochrome c subunit
MRLRHYFYIIGLTILVISLGLAAFPVEASKGLESGLQNPRPAADAENSACLACHQNPQFSVNMPNGDAYSLFVDGQAFDHSVHGESSITCVQCHVGFEPGMGHGFTAASKREATLRLNETCARCHADQSDQEKDSAHAAARARGQMEAAICTDCHTAHEVRRIRDAQTGAVLPEVRAWIPKTCQKCHNAIYEKYRNSVHGAALTDESNPDVPTCIDCHGVHIIDDPRTATFRLMSPQICAKCHTDNNIMSKYGISTQVLNTYVADFHGTTVTIFEKVSPDSATNKPVCYDCHGIHDISRVDDPQKGLQVRENLLARCQQCHPNANTNFPESWMSHYIPSPEKYPIVYYVNLFYAFLIPGVLGPMGLLVIMDFTRMLINKFRPPSGHKKEKVTKVQKTEDEATYE